VDEEYGEECDSDDVTLCSGCRIPGGCGDGIVQKAQGEQCDLGALDNTGAYGGCTPGCLFAPNCGDGIVNGNETCDDGILDNSYGGCTPQCKRAAYCGDGNIDAAGKEECDNGTKNGTDGLCTPSCKAIIYVPS
jgi:cysteine-rich repeat protein